MSKGFGQENSLWRIFNHLDYLGLCISSDHKLMWVNASCKKLLSQKSERPDLQAFKKLFSKDDDWLVSKYIRDALDGNFSQRNFTLKTEGIDLVEINFCPINLGTEGASVLILMSKVVSESNNNDKEQKIEKLMVSQQRMAALGEVITNVSHEINNPLFVIYNDLDFLESELKEKYIQDEKNPIFERLERMREMSRKITQTLDAVQSLARQTEDGKFESTSIGEMIEVVRHLTTRNFNKSDINFEVCQTDHLPHIPCKRNEIEQVLLNLINNSLDAVHKLKKDNDEHKGWVKIEVNEKLNDVDIMVTDSGSGFTPEAKKSFINNDNSQSSKNLGIGVTKKIIEGHGGKIYIADNCENTRIVVNLPKAA